MPGATPWVEITTWALAVDQITAAGSSVEYWIRYSEPLGKMPLAPSSPGVDQVSVSSLGVPDQPPWAKSVTAAGGVRSKEAGVTVDKTLSKAVQAPARFWARTLKW